MNKDILDRIKTRAAEATKEKVASGKFSTAVKSALGLIGTGMAIGLAGEVAEAGVSSLVTPVKRSIAYRGTVKDNPWLSDYKQSDVKRFYNTLYKFSPDMAKDPVAAGSWLKKSLAYKDEGVQTGDLDTLSKIHKQTQSAKMDTLLRKAFSPKNMKDVHDTKAYYGYTPPKKD